MAATLQQPQQHTNPQLKRLVYSKYREMLGSYNDKANTIIQALPAYMVTEDKGFNFNISNDSEEDKDDVDFSVPLPPTLPTNGSLPARRIQTQAPPSEPPACVQNAMMTKDKKPFTYTPGGIDLSQIKSPRMAKRIARNAQYEGVTNTPKQSPLAQDQQNSMGVGAPPPASAMGVPVQVFPTGPPPPPPAPAKSNSSSNAPPPPPPMSQLTAQSNGRDARKSPTPQNFEPPPLGCRPEIKIPPNPMASLRKVPKVEPKNDFWIEEYRKERSKSPLPGEGNQQEESANQQVRPEIAPSVSSPPTKPAKNEEDESDPHKDPNRIAFQQQRQQYQPPQQHQPAPQPQQYQAPPQSQQYQPSPQPQFQSYRPNQPSPQQQSQEPSYPPHMDPNRIAFQQQRQQQPSEMAPVRTPAGPYQQQQRQQPSTTTPVSPRVDSPFRSQDHPSLQRPLSPIKTQSSPQQTPQSPYYVRQSQQQPQSPYQQQPQSPYQQQQQPRQNVTSPPPQQKPTQVGTLYIAPVPPENLATGSEQQPRSAGPEQRPSWLSQRPNMKENPEWVREVNSPPAANRTQTPPINANQQSSGPGLRLQMNLNTSSSNAKEHIIPIQIEKTPTPSRTPSTPGFGPQPYSPGSQQYGSVTSPGSGYSSPNVAVIRNPNQFVDQGYNNFPNQWNNQTQQQGTQQRVMSPPAQQGGGRVIPISIERDDGPFNPNVVRGPISPAPIVIQKVLQKITDTDSGRESDSEQAAELHGPQYSRQMGDANDQMRKMQINDNNQQAFVNRVDPRYRGGAIPSKTFQKLKSLTDKCPSQANKKDTTGVDSAKNAKDEAKTWGPIQRQTQRYVQQRPIYQQDDQPQQYVHPSEQQVHEPKIYTGSAIPSRSFKLLQAMTTPENAVKTEDSGVVENEQSNYYSPYDYPYPSPYSPSCTPLPYYIPDQNDPAWQIASQQPFYQPYSYYYPQYDTEGYGDYGNDFADDYDVKPIQGTPNIIITASDDDADMNEHAVGADEEQQPQYRNGLEEAGQKVVDLENEEESPIAILRRRLSQITNPDFGEETDQGDNKDLRSIESQDRNRLIPKAPCHEKTPEGENESEEESDELFTSSSSSEEVPKEKQNGSRDGLHAIKSVTNIKVYDMLDDDEQSLSQDKDSNEIHAEQLREDNVQDEDRVAEGFVISECHDDDSSNESEEEKLAEGIVDSGSDTEEENDITEDFQNIEIQNQLSVIYEEDTTESAERRNKKRTESFNSTSSTLSECSTTIANDQEDEEEIDLDNKTDTEEDDEEEADEENSVTVRLPLRLSFSRTSNDENITTVVVGDSEIQGSRRSSLKTIDDSTDFVFGDNDYQADATNTNDVSVTFSLPSRSNSMDRSGLISKTPSVDRETSAKDWDDSESDSESVSISVSLPMKRNKFMTQTLGDDLTNNIHEVVSDWDVHLEEESDEDDDPEDDTKREESTLVECIPETIVEEDEKEELEDEEEEEEEETSEEEEDEEGSESGDIKSVPDKLNDLNGKSSQTCMKNSEVIESANDMFDALREFRVWNDQARKRATEEREIIQKPEKLSLFNNQAEDDITKLFENLKNEEIKNKEGESEEDGEECSESTESSSSDEEAVAVPQSKTDVNEKKFNPLEESLSFVLEETKRKCDETFTKMNTRQDDNAKVSVRERIAAFEASKKSPEDMKSSRPILEITNNNTSAKKEILSRNSSIQRSESELEETDSGVTSDMSKPVSETDTDPECFTELKKMSRYQRAATHSRLFKLLQDESSFDEDKKTDDDEKPPEVVLRPKKKIIHNVSITRRSNPDAVKNAETMSQRRERLSLPLKMSNSIDADNLSTSNSPSSPAQPDGISEQLVNELVQSLLLKKDTHHLRNLPWAKLQAAAKRVLQEDLDLDSLENTSIESTPAMTPQDMKNEYQKSYADYYETWNRSGSPKTDPSVTDAASSKSFRTLHNQSPLLGQNQFRSVRCPRVLSSKSLNRDLSRVAESRESESPESYRSPRSSATPERSRDFLRASSLSRIGKV
ncbi:uncharacterized protein LOC119652564 isoform X3 [Hermetia illucens]|uniref:uncharacterized protein LOC119652564 isoform X3 n=1 Tax=Hermetia illucens TaxID=343691 RepID=UPI0018CC154D|nr:uncharacterized protein LOC119652564 isoform X3 [Hermetia illucens]